MTTGHRYHGALLVLSLICTGIATAQGQAPEFSVASVKPVSEARYAERPVAPEVSGTGFRCVCSLPTLTLYGYGLRRDEVIFPPGIKEGEWFQVAASFPRQSGKDVPLMVRRLLVERFGLVYHRESRQKPIYAMLIDRNGLKLRPSRPPESMEDAIRNPPRSVLRLHIDGSLDHLNIGGTGTLDEIARALVLDRPVFNMTGIPGMFDYAVDAIIPTRAGPPLVLMDGTVIPQTAGDKVGGPGSIFTEIRKLGLILEPRKSEEEFLVVDRLNRKPTEN